MNYKASILIIVVCILALTGLLFLASHSSKKNRPIDNISIEDHIYGTSTAKVILLEYSDYQCPACAAYQPYIKAIYEKYSDKISFVYRHFPLQQHPNAIPAALYSEAAGRQGKFWEMHDLLFSKQSEWEVLSGKDLDNKFISYAESLGLKLDQVKTDIADPKLMEKITGDWEGGRIAKVQWTPTFYINGVKLTKEIPGQGTGNPNPEDIEEAIKKALDIK